MTEPEFDRFLERWDLVAPVTMSDLAHIKAELDLLKAVGTYSELVLRGDRVEVVVGSQATACRRWLEVRGAVLETPSVVRALASRT